MNVKDTVICLYFLIVVAGLEGGKTSYLVMPIVR